MNNRIQLSGHGYEAWIAPERGASLVRLARPALAAESVRTPPDGPLDNPFLYGTPVLFPPNRIAGGHFHFAGKEYRLPVNEPATGCFLHGDLHQRAFAVVSASSARATLRYAAKAGDYLGFPHGFCVEIQYTLDADGLTQQASVTNQSGEMAPMAIGFHTTFQIPFVKGSLQENVRLRVSVAEEYLRDMRTYLPTWETAEESPLRDALLSGALIPCRETLSRHFRQGAEHRMVLTDHGSGVRMVYDTPDYDFWMIYNGGDPGFLSVEPQTCVNDAPHAPFPRSGMISLAPGETRGFSSHLRLESE